MKTTDSPQARPQEAPERIWIDGSGKDQSFWNDNGDSIGTVEYVRADLPRATVDDDALVERLAELAHKQWSGWMNYMFKTCTYRGHQSDGYVLILPTEYAERWLRQTAATYSELPDNERESDREEARRMMAVFESAPRATEGELTVEAALVDLRGLFPRAEWVEAGLYWDDENGCVYEVEIGDFDPAKDRTIKRTVQHGMLRDCVNHIRTWAKSRESKGE